jgi:two-component system CheB/CheR fusion protein
MKPNPKYIVGIGSSSGGLIEMTRFFSTLSANSSMAFIVISHISPTETFHLSEILARHTTMPVIEAVPSMEIRANHVYIVPKDSNLFLDGGCFVLQSPRKLAAGRHTQFSCFLISLAQAVGKNSIAVITSGEHGDGMEGCKYIREQGGHIFFLDNLSASGVFGNTKTPSSSDRMLKPEEISKQLELLA